MQNASPEGCAMPNYLRIGVGSYPSHGDLRLPIEDRRTDG